MELIGILDAAAIDTEPFRAAEAFLESYGRERFDEGEFKGFNEGVDTGLQWIKSHCPYCDGAGFYTVVDQVPGRDPNNPDGEPIPEPVAKQIECQWCSTLSAEHLKRKE